MTSIRGRLLGWLTVGLLALFAVAGVLIYGAVKDRVEADFEDELRSMARTLSAGLELEIEPAYRAEAQRLGAMAMPDPNRTDTERAAAKRDLLKLAEHAFRVRLVLSRELFPAALPGGEAPWFAVLENGEQVIATSLAPEGRSFQLADLAELPFGRDRRGFREGFLTAEHDGQTIALLAREVRDVRFGDPGWSETWQQIRGKDSSLRKSATVLMSRGRAGIERLLAQVRNGLLIAGIALAVLIALTSWWVVSRGLAPVNELSEQVGALDAQTLGERVDEKHLPRELQPIAHRLNEALERIEHSVERERQTAAHIAHELRTPLAELQSITEIAIKWPEETELQARAVKDSHEVALHMSRVVAALMKVARAGTADGALVLDTLDVVPIVRAAWEGLGGAASERSQTLNDDLPDSLDVRTDPDVAEAVVSSLLKNAIQHAPPGSAVRVGSAQTNGRVAVTIANPAPDLDADDVAHLAEAFWRKDAARTRSDEGGLGLTLAFELCRSADIEVRPALVDAELVLTLGFPQD